MTKVSTKCRQVFLSAGYCIHYKKKIYGKDISDRDTAAIMFNIKAAISKVSKMAGEDLRRNMDKGKDRDIFYHIPNENVKELRAFNSELKKFNCYITDMDANIEKREVIDMTAEFKLYMAECKRDATVINEQAKNLYHEINKHLDNLISLNARGTEYYYYNNGLKKIKVYESIRLMTTTGIISNILIAYTLCKFIELVKGGAKYDLKKISKWQVGERYKIFDKYVRSDGPGNMLFGYFAKCLGIRTTVMNAGAGVAQIWDNLINPILKKKNGEDVTISYDINWLKSYGDDPYDQLCIKWGREIYDKHH